MAQPIQAQVHIIFSTGDGPNAMQRATIILPHPFPSGPDTGSPAGFPMGFPTGFPTGEQLTELMTRIAEAQSQQEAQKAHPASKKMVDSLPLHIISPESIPQQQCTVCLDEWEAGQEALEMPCGHLYHKDCLLPWLERANTCPSCRYPLFTEDAEFNKKVERDLSTRTPHALTCAMKPVGLCEVEDSGCAVSLSCGHSFHECCFATSLSSTRQNLDQVEVRCPCCRSNARVFRP